MAKNLIMIDGRYQQWTVASKSSGDPVLYGTMTGVALTDSDSSNKLTVDLGPAVYDLECKGVNDAGNSAIAIGDHIYYVTGDDPLLSKKASGYFFGYALEAVNSAATGTINVLIVPGPGPGSLDISAGAIATADIADGAITTAKISSSQVTATKIADGAILTAAISNSQITAAKISDGAILTAAISNSQITAAKISDGAILTAAISSSQVTITKLDSACISTLAGTAASLAASAVLSHTSSSAH